MDFIKKNDLRFDGRHVTNEQLMAYNFLLRESSKVVAEYAPARVEKPKAGKTRITTTTMFGLQGSATGEEGSRLARARHEENHTEKVGKVARKEDGKLENALEVVVGVTKGARELELHIRRISFIQAHYSRLIGFAYQRSHPRKCDEAQEQDRRYGSSPRLGIRQCTSQPKCFSSKLPSLSRLLIFSHNHLPYLLRIL